MAVDDPTMGSPLQYPSPPNSVATSTSIHPMKLKPSTFEDKIIKITVMLKQHIF
jgi:hypothetical protein